MVLLSLELLSVVISCYQLLSVVIIFCYQLLSVVISCYQLLSVAVYLQNYLLETSINLELHFLAVNLGSRVQVKWSVRDSSQGFQPAPRG